MPVFNGDTVAMSTHFGGQGDYGMTLQPSQELQGLGFHLFFFAADVGDDIAQNIHRWHAGVACAGNGLHGGDKDLLYAEALLDGLERHDEADGRAVGVGDHVAARIAAGWLFLDQVQMVGIDLGDHQWHVRSHSKGAGVGDNGAAGVGKARLEFPGDGGIECGKDDLGGALWIGRCDNHFGDAVGQRSVEAPLSRFSIGFAA